MKKHWNKQKKKKKNSNLTKIFRNFATINVFTLHILMVFAYDYC